MWRTLLVLLAFCSLSSVAYALPSALSFSTEPQTIPVAEISGKITVTTGEAPGETGDLFLSSSSATGEFSSSNTNWQPATQLTWNSNWSNRSFYYQDSAAGSHTITARLVTRDTQTTVTATQSITVGSGGGSTGNTGTTGSSSDDDGDTSGGPSTLSRATTASPSSSAIKVKAEMPTLAPVQTPVDFVVTSAAATANNIHYYWSFGDGAVSRGVRTTHEYLFPGSYVVVLTAKRGEDTTVLRSTIEVVEPKLLVSDLRPGADGYIELENQTGKELNLEHWQIALGGEAFAFPGPTYLGPKQKLKLSAHITGLIAEEEQSVSLHYPSAKVALSHEPVKKVAMSRVVEQAAVVALTKPQPAITKPTTITPAEPETKVVTEEAKPVEKTKTVIVGEKKPQPSWWQRLFK